MTENSDKKRRKTSTHSDLSAFSDTDKMVVRSTADLGRVLQFARKRHNLSQEELAMLTDLRRSYLSEIEGGVTTERFDRLFTLLDALGLELSIQPRRLRRRREPT
jgi:ribosome-binding protein aMBF1 (putative translation factor)